eukprot:7565383-Pyramimonas_sp.AAC.1
MQLEKQTGIPFTWLCATNKGSEEVSAAALRLAGVTPKELEAGFDPDPASRVQIKIVAKPGLLVRLTRTLDKVRGFVNGATAVIYESLCGNE